MYESRGITQYYQANPYESEKHEYGFIDSENETEAFYKKDGNTMWKQKIMKDKKDPASIMMSSHEPRQQRKIKLTENMMNKDSEIDYFIDDFQGKVQGHSPLSMHKELIVPTITISKKSSKKKTKTKKQSKRKSKADSRKRRSKSKKPVKQTKKNKNKRKK